MKKTSTLLSPTSIFVLVFLSFNSYGQQIPLAGGAASESAAGNQVVSIGNVPGAGPPALNLIRARLHVNSFFMPASTAPVPVGAGEVFRTTGPDGVINSWRLFTSAANPGTEKFSLFTGTGVNVNNVFQQTTQPGSRMTFLTGGGTPANQRMIITQNIAGIPRVGIGNNQLTTPLTYLHLGEQAFANVAGFRNQWMDLGLYIHSRFGQNHDNMYFGFRQTNPTQTEAIINWGNNPTTSTEVDRLLFNFTADPNTPFFASGVNGLEIARMSTDGNNGRTGFGGDPNIPNLYSTGSPDPQNTVEINSPLAGPTTVNPAICGGVATGASGLRFTDLTSASSPCPPNNLSLSVDANGDVILVPSGASLLLCTNPASILPLGPGFDGRVGLNGNNFYFEGQGPINTNNVGIGIACGAALLAKLDVRNTVSFPPVSTRVAGNFINTGSDPNSAALTAAVLGRSIVIGGIGNLGGGFNAVNATGGFFCLGVSGAASGAITTRGVSGFAQNGTNNYGGFFQVPQGNLANFHAAVYGTAPQAQNHWAGYFTGNVFATSYSGSDSLLKRNIAPINGLNIVRQLKPHSFNFKTTEFSFMSLPSGTQFGLTAQDVETVAPQLVQTAIHPEQFDSLGNSISPSLTFKALNYDGFIPITIGAIKQLDSAVSFPPSAPALISPAQGATVQASASFAWSHPSASVFFQLQASLSANFSIDSLLLINERLLDTVRPLGISIRDTVTVFWRVRAFNAAGASPFSQTHSFTLLGSGEIGPAPIRTQTGVAFNSASDSRLKTNLAPVTSALSKVNALNAIYYNWVQTPGYELDTARQIGLIAQDVQGVIPEVVHTDINGNLTLDYGRLVPLLVEAIKELQTSNLKLQTPENIHTQDITLSLPDAPVLGDARPNPNTGKAEIPYYLPDNISNAKIIFTDMLGRIMDEKTLETGYGLLNISTQNLPNGTYTYTLVLNGKTFNTKTMLKTK